MSNRLTFLFSRKMLRLLLIAGITLYLGINILLPEPPPGLQPGAVSLQQSNAVWRELIAWRVAMSDATHTQQAWPQDIQAYAPDTSSGMLTVSSPQPYMLQVDMAQQAELEGLAGTQLLLTFNPQTHDWQCRAGQPPVPEAFQTQYCEKLSPSASGLERTPADSLRPLVYGCVIVFVLAALALLIRLGWQNAAQLQPAQLRRTPLYRLPALNRLLRWTARLGPTLLAANLSRKNWERAVSYGQRAGQRTWIAQVRTMAEQVSAQCLVSVDWELQGHVFEWQFHQSLPVSLDRCFVYVPAAGLREEAMLTQLRAAQTGNDVFLILCDQNPDQPFSLLRAYAEDRANLYVMVDSANQTEWLLSNNAQEVMLRILAAQLRVTRISPYQTRGGVTREGLFFGREQLLARIINREPANYLVVGGRQLGKSSLLKAVQRRYQGHPHIVCHYVSLRDHRLAPRLALQLGLTASATLDDITHHLRTQQPDKRHYILIDEADRFFRGESNNDYEQLSELRALSDEGRCWFMLAGFWDLYAAAVLDYQSPLRNFGEVLVIGGLERDACRELATEPLRHLRLGFASNSLVEQLIDSSGQRANLTAMICQECLESLEPGERIIESRHLQKAMASQAVQDALAGWGHLSSDDIACRIDRAIVYHTALHGQADLSSLSQLLAERMASFDALLVKHALARLQLAYVLKKQGADYRFAVPLLFDQFDHTETSLLLSHELEVLSKTLASPDMP